MNPSNDENAEGPFDDELRRYTEWCKGDKQAGLLCVQLLYIAHVWDDIVDQDVERPAEHIDDAFWLAMVDVRENPFYRRHEASLQPLITSTILDWHVANSLEREGDHHDRTIAYTLRVSVLSLMQYIVYLAGGYQWVREVGAEMRRYGQRETLDEYMGDLSCQTQ